MRTAAIVLAVAFGLFGFRLLATGVRSFILLLKVEAVPKKNKEGIFRDLLFGVLFVILAIALLT